MTDIAATSETALVIFDMDGVLVDSEPVSCRMAATVLQECGFAYTEADIARRFIGVSTPSMIAAIEAEHGRKLPAGFQEELRDRTLEAFETSLEAVAGMAEMLASLERPLCVASSSHPDRIRRSLEIAGLVDFLAPHFYSATMVQNGKPAPDIFLHAAADMGHEPERCLVVEDSVAGLTAARAAGMTAIGLAAASHIDPARDIEQQRQAGAHAIARSADELGALIAQWRAGRDLKK